MAGIPRGRTRRRALLFAHRRHAVSQIYLRNCAVARACKSDIRRGHGTRLVGRGDRQAHHVRASIEEARRDGLTHLLALDVDELLCVPTGLSAFHNCIRRLPVTIASIHCRNLEALVPSHKCRNPFADARAFKHRPWEYGAYGYPPSSGKSLGVLSVEGLTTNGPHHFGIDGKEMDGSPLYAEGLSIAMPHSVGVLLHYESCTYSSWKLKFEQMASASNGSEKSLAFSPFYAESVKACAAVIDAREKHASAAVDEKEKESAAVALKKAERQCQVVWSGWRVAPRTGPSGLPPPPPSDDGMIRVLKRLGLTLIDPPPAAAAAARAAAARLRNLAEGPAAAVDVSDAAAAASVDEEEDPVASVFATSELLHIICERHLDALSLLSAGHVNQWWRGEVPKPPDWSAASVVQWVLERDAEMIELEEPTRAVQMYQLANKLRRGQISVDFARESAFVRFSMDLGVTENFKEIFEDYMTASELSSRDEASQILIRSLGGRSPGMA